MPTESKDIRIKTVECGGHHSHRSHPDGPRWTVPYTVATTQADGKQDPLAFCERIQDCVNACQGMADPAHEIQNLRNMAANPDVAYNDGYEAAAQEVLDILRRDAGDWNSDTLQAIADALGYVEEDS